MDVERGFDMRVFGDCSKPLPDVLATTDCAPVETSARDKLHRIIDIFFSRYPQEQKRFTCIGQDLSFAPLLETLRSDDSWEENNIKANSHAGNTNLSLLLLSVSALK